VGLGAPELLIILFALLLLFGSTKLPNLARSLGQAQSEFRRGIRHGAEPDEGDGDADPPARGART
jgi:sec-independent protein translocase protein TatA